MGPWLERAVRTAGLSGTVIVGLALGAPGAAAEGSTERAGGAPGELEWADPDEPSSLTFNERPYWRRNLFRRVGGDQKLLVTRWWPSKFRRMGFAVPVLAGVAAATTSSGDEPGPDLRLERYVEERVNGEATGPAQAISDLGATPSLAALVGTTYLIGRWTRNERLSEVSSLSAEVLLDVAIWSEVLKRLSGRTRPSGGGQGDFFVFQPRGDRELGSFPSGHAMGAFAVATIVAEEYRDHRWVPWVAYGVGGLITGSRVALGRHFPSDVVVGAILGRSMGRMVLARRDGELRRGRVGPYLDPATGTYGLGYTRTW